MLVSFIVPIYNGAKHIDKCVCSILNQSTDDFEIILVDDGSTDDSVEKANKWKNHDKRVRVIENVHQGLIATRKSGVAEAKGRYICFVDVDDWIEEKLLESAYYSLENEDVDIWAYNFCSVRGDDKNKSYNICDEGLYQKNKLKELYKNMMFDFEYGRPAIIQALWTKIIRKEILIGIYSHMDSRITYGEDAAVVYEAFFMAQKIRITNEVFYNYLINSDSMCHTKDIGKFEEIRYFQEYMETTIANDVDVYGLKKQIKGYIFLLLQIAIKNNYELNCAFNKSIPEQLLKDKRKVALYGAGAIGCMYYKQLLMDENRNCSIWVDVNKYGTKVYDRIIQKPSELCKADYDCIIVAVASENMANDISDELVCMGVGRDRIKWAPPANDCGNIIISYD